MRPRSFTTKLEGDYSSFIIAGRAGSAEWLLAGLSIQWRRLGGGRWELTT